MTDNKPHHETLWIFKEALDNSTDAIGMSTPQGRHYYQNRAFDQLFGSVGAFPPDTMYVNKRIGEEVFKTIMSGGQFTGEVKMYAHNRRILDVFLRAYANTDSNGTIVSLIGIHTDITERKRSEEALRESEERLRQIIDLVPHFIFAKDINGRFILVNKAVADAYGTTVEQLTGMTDKDFAQSEEEVRHFREADLAVFESGTPQLIPEEKITDSQGTVRFLSTAKIPFTFSENRLPAVLGVSVDISARKRAEQEQEKLQAQLAQAQKMESIGRLAGGVAHDFNNILAVILGHTEMALQHVLPNQSLFIDLTAIRKAAKRSVDLIRQLMAFARKQTISPQVLDVNQTVAGMLAMLQRLIGEAIDLEWKPGSNLWPIEADPIQIEQILANLCVNARDAIAGVGKIFIKTGNTSFDENYCARHSGCMPGEYVMLSVSDNGCGMDTETLANLFEPFYTTKEVGKGTGLGLSTIYGIVKQNSGFINVDSRPNQGSRFTIHLPRYTQKDAQTSAETASATAPAARGSETILLVEDDPEVLQMSKTMLGHLGYCVLTAATPNEAIRLTQSRSKEIDLIITDLIMPEMNGRELARNLLNLHPNVKCLFMSGHTDDVIATHGVLDAGVHFIQKPFSMHHLAEKIRVIMDS